MHPKLGMPGQAGIHECNMEINGADEGGLPISLFLLWLHTAKIFREPREGQKKKSILITAMYRSKYMLLIT